jgi:hypothetical protein
MVDSQTKEGKEAVMALIHNGQVCRLGDAMVYGA